MAQRLTFRIFTNFGVLLSAVVLAGCGNGFEPVSSLQTNDMSSLTAPPTAATPVATPTPTPVATPTATPIATPAPNPSATPAPTPAATPVASPTPASTPAPTPAPSPIATPVATPKPSPTPSPTPVATSQCLSRTNGSVLALSTSQVPYINYKIPANTRVDLRNINYVGNTLKPLRLQGYENSCASGGMIMGSFPLSTTWTAMHDTYAIDIRAANFLLENARVHNYGDCVSMWEGSTNFTIRGLYCSQIRDDAVSNDNGYTGLVDDSLFDGVYMFFSDRSWAAALPDAVTTIRNSLVRMRPYDQTFHVGVSGHGWFWKQDTAGAAVKLRLHGNVFMAEQASTCGTCVLEPSTILSCKKSDGSPDNTIVWLGTGPYPRPDELKTGCFKLTTDRAVWDSAVANWKTRHGY